MVAYTKPWLPLQAQAQRLIDRGLETDLQQIVDVLQRVGYYRLTGYLYPFRESDASIDDGGPAVRVLNTFRAGTSIKFAESLIDFDRDLRALVLVGVERFEVALRMQLGYVIGRQSAFAHLEPRTYVDSFTAPRTDIHGLPMPSKLEAWINRAQERQDASDEAFVAHFRDRYDGQMPIWVLTEVLEMGQISRLYAGLRNDLGTEIAHAFSVPTKKLMQSWTASINYIRNVAAHHARLFNRKLVSAPGRPTIGQVTLLDHLRDGESAKQVFGLYNALAILAYLQAEIEPQSSWRYDVRDLLVRFPEVGHLTVESLGAPSGWTDQAIWSNTR